MIATRRTQCIFRPKAFRGQINSKQTHGTGVFRDSRQGKSGYHDLIFLSFSTIGLACNCTGFTKSEENKARAMVDSRILLPWFLNRENTKELGSRIRELRS